MTATIEIIQAAEQSACGCEGDHIAWCFVCRRPTCHAGEHSAVQLLRFAEELGMEVLDQDALRVATTLDSWREGTWLLR